MATKGDLYIISTDPSPLFLGRKEVNRFFIANDAMTDTIRRVVAGAVNRSTDEGIDFTNALICNNPAQFILCNANRESGYTYIIDTTVSPMMIGAGYMYAGKTEFGFVLPLDKFAKFNDIGSPDWSEEKQICEQLKEIGKTKEEGIAEFEEMFDNNKNYFRANSVTDLDLMAELLSRGVDMEALEKEVKEARAL